MSLVELAAVAAAVLIAGVIAFQVALAAGVPLGEATMGGRAATVGGVLQPPYRAVALGSAVVLGLAAWIVLGRADLVPIFLWRSGFGMGRLGGGRLHGAEHGNQPIRAASAGAMGHELDHPGRRPPRWLRRLRRSLVAGVACTVRTVADAIRRQPRPGPLDPTQGGLRRAYRRGHPVPRRHGTGSNQ